MATISIIPESLFLEMPNPIFSKSRKTGSFSWRISAVNPSNPLVSLLPSLEFHKIQKLALFNPTEIKIGSNAISEVAQHYHDASLNHR
jgi:hypothetical protein